MNDYNLIFLNVLIHQSGNNVISPFQLLFLIPYEKLRVFDKNIEWRNNSLKDFATDSINYKKLNF